MLKKLFSLFTYSKKRKFKGTKRNKRSIKRHTRRVRKMRGGWGTPMSLLPEMFKKGGVMKKDHLMKDGLMKDNVTNNIMIKGGWGGPVNATI